MTCGDQEIDIAGSSEGSGLLGPPNVVRSVVRRYEQKSYIHEYMSAVALSSKHNKIRTDQRREAEKRRSEKVGETGSQSEDLTAKPWVLNSACAPRS